MAVFDDTDHSELMGRKSAARQKSSGPGPAMEGKLAKIDFEACTASHQGRLRPLPSLVYLCNILRNCMKNKAASQKLQGSLKRMPLLL